MRSILRKSRVAHQYARHVSGTAFVRVVIRQYKSENSAPLRQYSAAVLHSGVLRSGTFGLTQICLDFGRFLRQDTGVASHGSTPCSGTFGLTQICLDFGRFLRQDTGVASHGGTLCSGTFGLTQALHFRLWNTKRTMCVARLSWCNIKNVFSLR